LFADKDRVRARPGDQHGVVIAGRFIRQTIELLTGLAGVHAGHHYKRPFALTSEQVSALVTRPRS
jgi:hypothetical protein